MQALCYICSELLECVLREVQGKSVAICTECVKAFSKKEKTG